LCVAAGDPVLGLIVRLKGWRSLYARDGPPCVGAPLAVFAALLLLSIPLRGEIVHLRSGGSLEGELLGQTDETYTIRTPLGVLTLPRDAVERVERAPSTWQQYEQRRSATAATAEAQYELARWCGERGLKNERRVHLEQALAADPDFKPARKALGHVRIGEMWVDGRPVSERAPRGRRGEAGGERPAGEPASAAETDKLIAAIQSQWSQRIQAIRTNLLETPMTQTAREGRNRILAIEDPLAILPLANILGSGDWNSRDALLDALARFPQDEATLYLAVLALLDPDPDLRRRAVAELLRRDDPRVVAQFREALLSDNDELIRRAAYALGVLKAKAAVPELIQALQASRTRVVEVPVPSYLTTFASTFNRPTTIQLGSTITVTHRPVLVIPTGNWLFPETALRSRVVTVMRSEARDALVAITGRDFGFNQADWENWYKEQAP